MAVVISPIYFVSASFHNGMNVTINDTTLDYGSNAFSTISDLLKKNYTYGDGSSLYLMDWQTVISGTNPFGQIGPQEISSNPYGAWIQNNLSLNNLDICGKSSYSFKQFAAIEIVNSNISDYTFISTENNGLDYSSQGSISVKNSTVSNNSTVFDKYSYIALDGANITGKIKAGGSWGYGDFFNSYRQNYTAGTLIVKDSSSNATTVNGDITGFNYIEVNFYNNSTNRTVFANSLDAYTSDNSSSNGQMSGSQIASGTLLAQNATFNDSILGFNNVQLKSVIVLNNLDATTSYNYTTTYNTGYLSLTDSQVNGAIKGHSYITATGSTLNSLNAYNENNVTPVGTLIASDSSVGEVKGFTYINLKNGSINGEVKTGTESNAAMGMGGMGGYNYTNNAIGTLIADGNFSINGTISGYSYMQLNSTDKNKSQISGGIDSYFTDTNTNLGQTTSMKDVFNSKNENARGTLVGSNLDLNTGDFKGISYINLTDSSINGNLEAKNTYMYKVGSPETYKVENISIVGTLIMAGQAEINGNISGYNYIQIGSNNAARSQINGDIDSQGHNYYMTEDINSNVPRSEDDTYYSAGSLVAENADLAGQNYKGLNYISLKNANAVISNKIESKNTAECIFNPNYETSAATLIMEKSKLQAAELNGFSYINVNGNNEPDYTLKANIDSYSEYFTAAGSYGNSYNSNTATATMIANNAKILGDKLDGFGYIEANHSTIDSKISSVNITNNSSLAAGNKQQYGSLSLVLRNSSLRNAADGVSYLYAEDSNVGNISNSYLNEYSTQEYYSPARTLNVTVSAQGSIIANRSNIASISGMSYINLTDTNVSGNISTQFTYKEVNAKDPYLESTGNANFYINYTDKAAPRYTNIYAAGTLVSNNYDTKSRGSISGDVIGIANVSLNNVDINGSASRGDNYQKNFTDDNVNRIYKETTYYLYGGSFSGVSATVSNGLKDYDYVYLRDSSIMAGGIKTNSQVSQFTDITKDKNENSMGESIETYQSRGTLIAELSQSGSKAIAGGISGYSYVSISGYTDWWQNKNHAAYTVNGNIIGGSKVVETEYEYDKDGQRKYIETDETTLGYATLSRVTLNNGDIEKFNDVSISNNSNVGNILAAQADHLASITPDTIYIGNVYEVEWEYFNGSEWVEHEENYVFSAGSVNVNDSTTGKIEGYGVVNAINSTINGNINKNFAYTAIKDGDKETFYNSLSGSVYAYNSQINGDIKEYISVTLINTNAGNIERDDWETITIDNYETTTNAAAGSVYIAADWSATDDIVVGDILGYANVTTAGYIDWANAFTHPAGYVDFTPSHNGRMILVDGDIVGGKYNSGVEEAFGNVNLTFTEVAGAIENFSNVTLYQSEAETISNEAESKYWYSVNLNESDAGEISGYYNVNVNTSQIDVLENVTNVTFSGLSQMGKFSSDGGTVINYGTLEIDFDNGNVRGDSSNNKFNNYGTIVFDDTFEDSQNMRDFMYNFGNGEDFENYGEVAMSEEAIKNNQYYLDASFDDGVIINLGDTSDDFAGRWVEVADDNQWAAVSLDDGSEIEGWLGQAVEKNLAWGTDWNLAVKDSVDYIKFTAGVGQKLEISLDDDSEIQVYYSVNGSQFNIMADYNLQQGANYIIRLDYSAALSELDKNQAKSETYHLAVVNI